jgi:hypothetical protein
VIEAVQTASDAANARLARVEYAAEIVAMY